MAFVPRQALCQPLVFNHQTNNQTKPNNMKTNTTTTTTETSLTRHAAEAEILLNMGAGSRAADALELVINHALDCYKEEMGSMGNPGADLELIERLTEVREQQAARRAADDKIWAAHSQRMTDKRNHGGL
jgi:methionine synthase I (cobalamin-dependent)